jgi:hypothetical protein
VCDYFFRIKLSPSLEENKDDDQKFDLAAELQKKFQHFEVNWQINNDEMFLIEFVQ